MKGAEVSRRPSIIVVRRSDVAVDLVLGLADLALTLALDLTRLALELLAVIVGQIANVLLHLARDFLRRALDLVLQAVRAEIVRHSSVILEKKLTCLSCRVVKQ